jgi:RNA polymerase-interacting CarD/CdnL/TRCF family regulator
MVCVFKRRQEATAIKKMRRKKSLKETREGKVGATSMLVNDLWQNKNKFSKTAKL